MNGLFSGIGARPEDLFEISEGRGVAEARWLGVRGWSLRQWVTLGMIAATAGILLLRLGVAPVWVCAAALAGTLGVVLLDPRDAGVARLTIGGHGDVQLLRPGRSARVFQLSSVLRLGRRRLRLVDTHGEAEDIDLSAHPYECVEALGALLDRSCRST